MPGVIGQDEPLPEWLTSIVRKHVALPFKGVRELTHPVAAHSRRNLIRDFRSVSCPLERWHVGVTASIRRDVSAVKKTVAARNQARTINLGSIDMHRLRADQARADENHWE